MMIGNTISHYQILEKLGEGGMGVVYKALDTKLQRTVALKFLPQELTRDRTSKSRFIQEAQTISAFDHPNIGTIYEIDETPEGQLYIVMAYYQGETLRQKIKDKKLKIEEIINIAIQVLQGLSKSHSLGIVHRDIKPANIIVTDEGVAKIIDFGLAKLSGQADLTKTRNTLGTTGYMSPQQICAEEVDERTDLWSVGVTLYEAITGQLPFKGEYEQSMIYSILSENPELPSSICTNVSKEIDHIIISALQKDPHRRFHTAIEFLNELKNYKYTFLEGNDRKDYKKVTGSRHKPPGRLTKSIIVLSTFIVILFVGIGYYFEMSKDNIVEHTIMIKSKPQTKSAQHQFHDMFCYLLVDDLLQSSRMNVLSESEFDILYPDKSPELTVSSQIEIRNLVYDIHVSIQSEQKRSLFTTYGNDVTIFKRIYDPSVLLTREITEITDKILHASNVTEKKKSTFTKNWDAFEQFYNGEKAFEKLDIPPAINFFRSALTIDPDFVLAKLRLADVLRFDRSFAEAKHLIKSIKPKLGLLSHIDSLKAESLLARLNDELRKEITILRKIYNRYPSRKESAYRIAEAYYQVCDINNAMKYYEKALFLDKNFPLAHNHLAYCYSHLGDHKMAIFHFKKYVDLDSTANAFDSLGDGYMAAGMLDSAVWAKERGIAIDPKLSYLYWGLVYIHLKRGNTEKAMQNAENYLYFAHSNEKKARGYHLKALIEYHRQNYSSSLEMALKAKNTFDSFDLVSRNHELHWLLSLNYLKLNRIDDFQKEINEMQSLIITHSIKPTNYRMYIYKYTLHLLALQAAKKGDLLTLLNVIKQFDEEINNKVKDHSSAFDLAFFYTTFGEIFLSPVIDRKDDAEECFKKALKYNPQYALAHYNLWILYSKTQELSKANTEKYKFRELFYDADEHMTKLYNING